MKPGRLSPAFTLWVMMVEEINCDILVVGAGLSGLAAASAASEKGAKVVLLEQNSFLGGTVIAGMHRYLCGFYGNSASRISNAGIARKLILSLRKLSVNNRPLRLGKVHVFAFRSKDLKVCLQALVRNKKNLKIILNSRAFAVKRKKGLILAVKVKKRVTRLRTEENNKLCHCEEHIRFAQGKLRDEAILARIASLTSFARNDTFSFTSRFKERVFTIRPKVVIDASGEGVIIKLSKAGYQSASSFQRQLAGFSFRLKGIKDENGLLPIKIPYYIKFASYTPLDNRGEGIVRLNIPAGRDILKVRNEARNTYLYLRKVLPEFKGAHIAEFSPYIIEREGICLEGEYTLTAGDVLSARKFKDGIVKNSWPLEIWDQKKGPQYRYLKSGSYYEIPLRCLKSKNIKNLLAAGRCISLTHEALGSARVTGTCISLGEQAGIAAVKLCASY